MCERWIKEGKGAMKWTRLSCRTFAANAVRLQLHALAYNLGNFLCMLATAGADQGLVADDLEGQADQDRREGGEPRPLCYLPAGRGRHRQMFQEILRLIAELRTQPPPALA